jgi:ribulose-phosphate 3-epimerase
VRIAPSLLAANFANLGDSIRPLKALSLNWLHLDIMDGIFVPNISFGPGVVRQIRAIDESMYFDAHLMIAEPRRYVKEFLEAGAQGVTFHVEAAGDDTGPLLRYIRRQGAHAGISIKPRTKVAEIREYLPFADLVLVMTVEPGFGGQKLIPSTLNKVRELVHLREELGLEYLIQVDGGIDPSTAPLAVAAGADVLVAGTSVFGGGKIRQNTRELRKSLNNVP